MNTFDKNKKYLIVVETPEKTLRYTGKIISFDDKFILFKDKFGKFFTYNLDKIVSFEELGESNEP